MTILVDEQIPLTQDQLAGLGEVRTFVGRDLTRQDLIDASVEILLVRSTTRVNAALLAGTAVRFVGSATAGIDHVDTAWLAAQNISFAYAPGSNAPAVVQYVLTAIDRLRTFDGVTLGIIGYGHVGSRLASAAEQRGMQVLVNDPPLHAAGLLDRPQTELTDLLQRADIVTLHVPLTEDGDHPTVRLLDGRTMAFIRPGTLLINTARGGVIDESEIPAGVDLVLDVFEGEPVLHRTSVERAVLATPHIAGYTLDAKSRGADAVARALERFLHGAADEPIQSLQQEVAVDPRRLESDLKEAWLADPTPTTFDRCRKEYVLV